jgi:hypothetical protein
MGRRLLKDTNIMRPWQHAKSSAAKSGGDWRQDLPIHEFLDITKAANADLRHRMLLHNADLGPALATKAFPSRRDVGRVALQHVNEDMGCEPTLHNWLSLCDLTRMPTPSLRRRDFARDDLVEVLTTRLQLASTDGPASVADILLLPRTLAPDYGDASVAVLCNSIGPLVVRLVLGPPREARTKRGGMTIFDPAWTAEAMIVWIMGRRIPSLPEVVGSLRAVPRPEKGTDDAGEPKPV